MSLFIVGLLMLLLGTRLYGRLMEFILGVDRTRPTPAVRLDDGVDFVQMPKWKNALIQLLNIAGIGPVIGVISGIKFGEIVFVIIPAGCIIMGCVHDFVAGMMSLRHDGANLPELVHRYSSRGVYRFFSIFISVTLLLVVAVFINVPANLTSSMFGSKSVFIWALVAIFAYYLVATLFPVDKIIGRFYPIFGISLLLGTVALGTAVIYHGIETPELLTESEAFQANMFTLEKNMPIIPMLFVTIACGILSGFHATQAPIVARTMKNEGEARFTFFTMMATEGFIAMVWSAAALMAYNKYPELMADNPNSVLVRITEMFLAGSWTPRVVVISVIVLAITSGDTALRSLRMSLAESLHISQRSISSRLLVTVPLVALVSVLLFWSNRDAKSFGVLWNYFAWSNQILAAITLAIGTVWMIATRRVYLCTLLPGVFIMAVVMMYILWISPAHGGPVGFGLNLREAVICALFMTGLIYAAVLEKGYAMRKAKDLLEASSVKDGASLDKPQEK